MKKLILIHGLIILFLNAFPVFFLDKVEFDNSIRSYAPKESTHFKDYKKYRELFGSDQVLVGMFRFETKLKHEDLKKRLSRFAQFSVEARKLKGVSRVFSLFDQDYIEQRDETIFIAPIVPIEKINSYSVEQILERMSSSDTARDLLVSTDLSEISIAIEPETHLNTYEKRELYLDFQELVKKYDFGSDLHALVGPMAVDVHSFETSFFDLLKFVPFTLGAGYLLMWFSFSSLGVLVVAMSLIAGVSSFSMGLFALFGLPFTIISSIVPTLLMSLSIAFFIHYFNMDRYLSRDKLYQDKKLRQKAVVSYLRIPCFFTAITTVAGLLTLALNEIPPIRIFGIITALCTFIILGLTLYTLPVLMQLFGPNQWKEESKIFKTFGELIDSIAKHAIDHPKKTVAIWALLLVIGIPFIFNIKVESNLLRFFKEDHIINKQTELYQNKFSGTAVVEMIFHSEEGELLTGETLSELYRFENDIVQMYEEVDKSLSPAHFIRDMHKAFTGKKELPLNSSLIDQYLFIYDGNDLTRFLDEDHAQYRIIFNVNKHNVSELEQLIEAMKKRALKISPKLRYDFSGQGYVFVKQNDLLVIGQTKSLWVSALVIFLLLLIQWRNLKDTVVSFVPNVLPLCFIFITMGVFGIWLDMGTAMIASVAIGIAVDDTIHIFSTFKNYLKKYDSAKAMKLTIQKTGRAVGATTIILCAQFLILSFSSFVPTKNFGLLTSLGLLVALFADVHLLPAMVVLTYKDSK
ncbi:MMPL family transporter [Halobacteriovorax sp. GB3]|uniref:efflux RND transporter permease subunit n=1 Tax=Halobacteriovorax sp. GB3 TaxID=2719615 RepID=UPI002362518F|nr:MMPL family transporter [Halobacteriovorax sp. GB3]MDD0853854.1 MMPL family transporter [Halobacteriovorax sp. GB3]